MVKDKKNLQETATTTEPVAVEDATYESKLRASLEEIRNYDGIIGYILRNTKTASIDLKDPAKIIDYAVLSSSTFDAGQNLSDAFGLSDVKSIIVGGKNAKMLCMLVDENKISIFMMKDAEADKVLKRMRAH
jgi:predicted regulator of Ras-like GTPase activity (Roadblock/LC7/MglB family)